MLQTKPSFDRQSLELDAAAETNRIVSFIQANLRTTLRKRGAVIGVSGGVDSSLVLALAAQSLGRERVLALLLPDRDSDPDSERLGRMVAARYGVEVIREEITEALEGFGCYKRRDAAIRKLFPEYDAEAGYKVKIVLPADLLDADTLNLFQATVVAPDGTEATKTLPPREFLEIVAASNFKQRARMSFLYYHAECRNFAVLGTANRNEHGQGFFVKNGDGGVDLSPIVHLYKTQVYQLAEYLDVPVDIRHRTPTSDTYSAPCSQQEFFFRLPFEQMDLLWHAQQNEVDENDAASAAGLTVEQVRRAFRDFSRKQQATEYLRTPPLELPPHPLS